MPDPKEADKIKVDPVTKTLTRCDVPLVLNPLDKNAMEAALQIKEQLDAQVSMLSKEFLPVLINKIREYQEKQVTC